MATRIDHPPARPGRWRTFTTLMVLLMTIGGCGSHGRSGSPAGVWSAGDPTTSPGSTAVSPSASTSASPAPTDQQQRRFVKAAALVGRQPGVLGVVVRDRQTGKVWRAGETRHPTWTASTIKLAMVVGLLERSRAGEITLDTTARQQIAAMLRVSDDNAATALWNRYGRDTQLPRFQQRYGMSGLTTVAGFEKFWGHLKCTAEDLSHLMSYVLDKLDPEDRAYVLDAMRHVGTIQQWGVWSAGATQHPGTKDGWSIEPDGGSKHWVTNTVGFAGPRERYVVAVMYDLPPGRTVDNGVHAVSDVVATVFGARVPATVTVPDPSTGL